MTARLYLSDSESRRAGEGPLLLVRPVSGCIVRTTGCIHGIPGPEGQPIRDPDDGLWYVDGGLWSGRAPWAVGDVVPAREAWWQTYNGAKRALYRADGPADLLGQGFGYEWSAIKWRPAPQMPDWAVRHRLRVVKVECRRVGSITEAEVLASGCLIPVSTDGCPDGKARPLLAITGRYPAMDYMPKGPRSTWTTADYLRAIYASAWMERHGKRAAWPDGWAWFSTMEAAR